MLLIRNAYIKTMAGADIESGSILVDNDKIVAVGAELTAPEGAEVIDAAGRLVTPGCVDAQCHIGLDNEAWGWEGRDYNEIVDPITPQMRAITINPATAIGIADRVGSLEPGKDADIVIWTADPLKNVGGEAHTTIVNGKIVYQA